MGSSVQVFITLFSREIIILVTISAMIAWPLIIYCRDGGELLLLDKSGLHQLPVGLAI
jgi:hypothetical protein